LSTRLAPDSRETARNGRPYGLTVAQFLLEQLRLWEVKNIYGVIGDSTLYLLDELAKQSGIRYIACKHEEGAALMASAEAKLTGRVAVCLATSGPGAVNLMNGLADAYTDGAPVLALTGQVETAKIGTRTKQYIDQQRLFSAVSGFSALLADPQALPEMMPEALVTAQTRGTVAHIAIPKNMYLQPVKGSPQAYGPYLHQIPEVPEEALRPFAESIRGCERPVLVAGRGIREVRGEFLSYAESIGAAVITTLPARPLFPNDHELYLGGLGQAGSEAAGILLSESDRIVLMGATWWPEAYVPSNARILQIDKEPSRIGISHEVEIGLTGDLRQILPSLLRLHKKIPDSGRPVWRSRIAEVKSEWKRKIGREASLAGTPVPPQTVMRILSEELAPDAVIAVDTGDHTLWFNRIFQARPNQEILVSGRWRTLGFALPAAISARLRFPERQAVAVAGDGGSLQTLMEFRTAVDHALPIVLVVLNNHAYAMEKNRMNAAGLATLGSLLENPDFARVAEACGGLGFKASDAEQLREYLRRAFLSGRPALIEVETACPAVPHTKI